MTCRCAVTSQLLLFSALLRLDKSQSTVIRLLVNYFILSLRGWRVRSSFVYQIPIIKSKILYSLTQSTSWYLNAARGGCAVSVAWGWRHQRSPDSAVLHMCFYSSVVIWSCWSQGYFQSVSSCLAVDLSIWLLQRWWVNLTYSSNAEMCFYHWTCNLHNKQYTQHIQSSLTISPLTSATH